jgi:hypothetical protein
MYALVRDTGRRMGYAQKEGTPDRWNTHGTEVDLPYLGAWVTFP